MAQKSPSLATILEEQKAYIALSENGTRIRCLLTTHEMPARVDAVLSHLNGKKFKKAKDWYKQDYFKYLPYIVADKKSERHLFCRLTRTTLNKIPKEVEKHVNGQRFMRLKESYESREAKRGQEDDEDDDDDEEGAEGDDGNDGDRLEDYAVEIDVEEEASKAAAAGVWMPMDELKQLSGMIKQKGSKRKAVEEVEEEEEVDDVDEGVLEGDDAMDSDDSDADLALYIREEPIATNKAGKGGTKIAKKQKTTEAQQPTVAVRSEVKGKVAKDKASIGATNDSKSSSSSSSSKKTKRK